MGAEPQEKDRERALQPRVSARGNAFIQNEYTTQSLPYSLFNLKSNHFVLIILFVLKYIEFLLFNVRLYEVPDELGKQGILDRPLVAAIPWRIRIKTNGN